VGSRWYDDVSLHEGWGVAVTSRQRGSNRDVAECKAVMTYTWLVCVASVERVVGGWRLLGEITSVQLRVHTKYITLSSPPGRSLGDGRDFDSDGAINTPHGDP
jgi:hypothetical protein